MSGIVRVVEDTTHGPGDDGTVELRETVERIAGDLEALELEGSTVDVDGDTHYGASSYLFDPALEVVRKFEDHGDGPALVSATVVLTIGGPYVAVDVVPDGFRVAGYWRPDRIVLEVDAPGEAGMLLEALEY